MSSSHLASTVFPHVGGKADQCSATSAADCADQVIWHIYDNTIDASTMELIADNTSTVT